MGRFFLERTSCLRALGRADTLGEMALFSRRKKSEPSSAPPEEPAPDAVEPVPAAPAPSESEAASVGISVSTFRGVGAAQSPDADSEAAAGESAVGPVGEPRHAAPAEAPPPSETLPGLPDNVLLRDALAALGEPPATLELMNVARQLLQGQLFLRVKGDARKMLSEGKGLPLSVSRQGDAQFVQAFSSGEALRASVRSDGDTDTSAVAQPVMTVLRHVLDGPFEGLVIDPFSAPARALLPRPLLERAVEQAHDALAIKGLLSSPRTGQTPGAVVAALREAPLWLAVRRAEEGGQIGVAESRTADGSRYLEVFSHPLEVLALGRSDQALPVTAAQLARALRTDTRLTGLVVDPAGPWVRLSRSDLEPLLESDEEK